MKSQNLFVKTEQKIASFTQSRSRLQLVMITKMYFTTEGEVYDNETRYQVRLNRKIIDTSISEYTERKLFAQMVQNIVLLLKIY